MKVESRKNLQFKYNLYRLSLVSFTTVIFWIGFEIFRSYNKPKPTKVIQQQIEALNPNLDIEAINLLESRIHIDLSDLTGLEKTLVSSQQETPPPTITSSPQSSPSAVPVEEPTSLDDPEATDSANTN